MAARTRSSRPATPPPPSRSGAAVVSVLLGILAVASLPVAIAAAELTTRLKLLESVGVGVGAALGLALLSLLCVRLARRTARRTLRPERIQSTLRWGRRLAALGLYFGLTGAVALAFYAALKAAE